MKFWKGVASVALLCGVTGCATEEEAPAQKGPTFNYIPLNENVCELPEDPTAQVVISGRLQSLGASRTTAAAVKLAVCTECAEDKLGALLNSVTKPVKLGETEVQPQLLNLVNSALAFPYRELLLSWSIAEDGAASVALVQGVAAGLPTGHAYFVQAESLAKDCQGFNILVNGTATTTLDAEGDVSQVKFETADPAANAFGFQVPTDLPDLALPADEVAALIAAKAGLNLRLGKPEVTFDVDGAAGGKGTISGWIEPGQFQDLVDSGVDITPFIDENAGAIRAVLSFDLVNATVQSGIEAAAIAAIAPTEDGEDVLPATAVHPAPPADSLGLVGDCVDCLHIEGANSKLCGKTDVPTEFLRVQSKNGQGTFKIRASGPSGAAIKGGGIRLLSNTLGNVGGSVTSMALGSPSVGLAVQVKVPFRSGLTRATPACSKLIESNAKVTKFAARDGWQFIDYAPTQGVRAGCKKTIAVCFDYSQTACKKNEQLDSLGGCECKAGFAQVGTDCISAAGLPKLPAGAIYVRDAETNEVEVECPDDFDFAQGACVPDPCEDEDACPDDQECELDEATGKKLCIETDDDEPVPVMTKQKLASEFKAIKTILKGKADAIDDQGMTEDVGSGDEYESEGTEEDDEIEDEDDDKADLLKRSTSRAKRKPSMINLRKMRGKSKAAGKALKLSAGKARKIGGKSVPVKAPISTLKSYRDQVLEMTTIMNAAQYKEFEAARKIGLPSRMSVAFDDMRHDEKMRTFFKAAKGKTRNFKVRGVSVAKPTKPGGKYKVTYLLQASVSKKAPIMSKIKAKISTRQPVNGKVKKLKKKHFLFK